MMNRVVFICFLCTHLIYAKSDKECIKTICNPTAGDLLIGRETMLRASSTCGLEHPENYCVVTLKDRGRDSKCSICDSRHPYNLFSSRDSHRIGNVLSRLPQNDDRWWQSSNGIHNVSIEVEFVTEFQFIYTQLRFKTYRPAAMYIERSKDYGRSWQKSAFFSDNCAFDFPNVPERKRNDISEITCTSEFSSISPSEGGTVLFVATPSDLHTNDEDWVAKKNDITAITNLRVQFVRLHTFGDWKIDNNPNILNKYHYAVSEWIIRGRCSCYGHASECKPKMGEIQLKEMVYGVCVCRHNTIGANCEKCKDFYNDIPWMPAQHNSMNECKKCECNNHSTSCHFNSAIFHLSGRKSGGKCDNCIHNTEGINCQRCASGYYRNSQVNISSIDTCLKCKCDNYGTKFPGLCNQETEPDQNIVAGSCTCKRNVDGFYCDRCKSGYWNFTKNDDNGCTECQCLMSGTVNNDGCDERTGKCICKSLVEGDLCNTCKDGYYNISASNPSGCSPCGCNSHGSLNGGKCDRSSGQCKCKPGYKGITCNQIKEGWFFNFPRYPLKFGKNVQIELPPVYKSGFYNFIITFDTQEIKLIDTYVAILLIDHSIKTTCPGSQDTLNIQKDTKTYIVPNKCLIKDLPINIDVLLFVDPSAGSNRPVIVDIKVVPNLALNSSQTKMTLNECLKYPPRARPPKCQFLDVDRSTGLPPNEDPMKCNCNVTGSVNHICEKLGGQCKCLPNVIGRQCNQCKSTFYGFDAMGCKNCSCEPSGSLNLQCSFDTGKCMCKVGVEGRHCNYCKAGFWKFPSCESCKCNALADVCDAKTGQCKKCRGDSVGFNCEKCKTGYYGDPSKNIQCLKCNCPGLSSGLNHSTSCNLIANTTTFVCHCKPGYKGQFCDECEENYFGNPRQKNGRCTPCNCSGNIDRTVSGSCDVKTGDCKKCLYSTAGTQCEKCAPGYFGHGVSRTCKKCVCNRLGTNLKSPDICHHETGSCPCLPNVIGQQCDKCQVRFYNISSGTGCVPCQCDSKNGALNETCNHLTGQCHCRQSRGGRQCDKCEDGYWGNPRLADGCKVCLCNNEGSVFNQCDRNNGDCLCKPGITGKYCDRCSRGTDGEMPNCSPCGDCWNQWDRIIDKLLMTLNDYGKGTTESIVTPSFPRSLFPILDKILLITKHFPNDMTSQVDQIRDDVNNLKIQLASIKQVGFNEKEYNVSNLLKTIEQTGERVATRKIKDFGGAYSIIVKSLESIIKSVNDTLEAVNTIPKIKSLTSDREQKMKHINQEEIETLSKELLNFENLLKSNLQTFNNLTCNTGSNANVVSCSDVCGGVGCQPTNCFRNVHVNELCFRDHPPKFFNAYAWNVDKRNFSNSNLDKIGTDLQRNLNETVQKTITNINSTKLLVGVTNKTINSRYNQVIQLLTTLKITINSSTSEQEFKKLLDAIRNFSLIKHKEEIQRLETDIKLRIQQLDNNVNEVMKKSKTNRNECNLLKTSALQTKKMASNLLRSIKELEDNNEVILKIHIETTHILSSMTARETNIKREFDEIDGKQNETHQNQIYIDKIIKFLKAKNEDNDKSIITVQKNLNSIKVDQDKIATKLDTFKAIANALIQNVTILTENMKSIKIKSDDKRYRLVEKISKLTKYIEKTREKVSNAKQKVAKRELELRNLGEIVEGKLERIIGLEFEMHKKSEFQSTCLP